MVGDYIECILARISMRNGINGHQRYQYVEKEWSWKRVVKRKQNGGQFDIMRRHSVLPLSYTATIFLNLCPCSLKKWRRV